MRGRAGTAIGRLTGLLATLKGLPLAYNRDLQEDKEPVFAQADAYAGALDVLALAYDGLRFDGARMAAAADDGLSVATDVAEALVREGVPFREAHERVASRIAAGERFAAAHRRGRPGGALRARHAGALARAGRRAAAAGRRDARRNVMERFPAPPMRPAGRLAIGGVDVEALAARFGTPLYVYDAATVALPRPRLPGAAGGHRRARRVRAQGAVDARRAAPDPRRGARRRRGQRGRGGGGAPGGLPRARPRGARQRQERRRPRRGARRGRRPRRARRARGGGRPGRPGPRGSASPRTS